jgi:PTS system mannose-specific IIA component
MARVIVVTQGALAEELARGARTIAGPSGSIETVSLDWDESLGESERKVAHALFESPEAVAAAGRGEDGADSGVLILTDVPGGTPFNVAKKFARPGKVEVLAGVNLPMVVRLCCPGCQDQSVGELARWLLEKGRQSISHYEPDGSRKGDRGHG